MDTAVIITAAGSSRRMGMRKNKLALNIDGQPVIRKTVRAFLEAGLKEIFLVVPENGGDDIAALVSGLPVTLVAGGATRQESVFRGLLATDESVPFVLIHDGARPFVTGELIRRVLERTRTDGACFPGVPVTDTTYGVEGGLLNQVLRRDELMAVQTPQGFRRELILQAHHDARTAGVLATDDAALVRRLGAKVSVVAGDENNIKLTTPGDWARVTTPAVTRVGMGVDVHRLVAGRRLVLGGVEIAHELGLLGHSDADVMTHAVMDALLGAVGLGDIGQHFPDTSDRYRDAVSIELLREVRGLLRKQGVEPLHIDITLLLERPKIGPYRAAMQQNIAAALDLPASAVNVKATTNEGLGFIGAQQGAVCYATATVKLSKED